MATTLKAKRVKVPGKRELKYVRMAQDFRDQVRAGVLKPGDQLPSFARMQAEHGLGQATLERTYAILEEERLIVRRHGRGIFVADAQALPVHKVIGFATDTKSRRHPYYAHLLKGAQEAARQKGVELLLLHEDSVAGLKKVDGILHVNHPPPARSEQRAMPGVTLLAHEGNFCSVAADDRGGTRGAVEHLLELGHRRIAFLTLAQMKDPVSASRLGGYEEALRAARIKPDAAWVRNLREPSEPAQRFDDMGRKRMNRWLDEDWDALGCTAILAQNDETAIGIIEALQEAGLRVPTDVSVVGFDGTEAADYFRPRLTTIEVPLEEIGARGAELLIAQIEQPHPREAKPPETIVLPAVLRVGDSTAKISSDVR